VDVAPVAAHHDPVAHVQPEPRAGAHVLRREERLEDAPPDGLRYAGAVVRDLDEHQVLLARRPDPDAPAPADGVYGVGQQGGPYLVQLAAVGRYGGEGGVEIQSHLDPA
jgi:hypothetical protein